MQPKGKVGKHLELSTHSPLKQCTMEGWDGYTKDMELNTFGSPRNLSRPQLQWTRNMQWLQVTYGWKFRDHTPLLPWVFALS